MATDPKRAKLENGYSHDKQEVLTNFEGFEIKRILSENAERKNVTVEGTFGDGRRALVVLERLPLRGEILKDVLNEKTKLRAELVNDIYGQYECIFEGKFYASSGHI